jgi:regulator of sigma E protease
MNSFDRAIPNEAPIVGRVAADGPADRGGIRPGDVVLAVDGQPVQSWVDLKHLIGSVTANVVLIDLRRGGEVRRVEVEPDVVPGMGRVIGIGAEIKILPAPGLIGRVGAAAKTVRDWFYLYVRATGSAITGRAEIVALAGPVALRAPDDSAHLAATTITFSILNCFSLCLLLPYLDGRRILFLVIEMLVHKPLHPKYEQWFNRAGIGLFAVLFLLVLRDDVVRLGAR